MPRCLLFLPPRNFNGITPWSSSGAVAIVASIGRLVDWKNWLIYCRAANSLCTFFPSGVQQIVCGTIETETETVVVVGIPREFALNLLFILVCFFLHWTRNNAGDYKNLLMALGCWTRADSLVFQLSLLPEQRLLQLQFYRFLCWNWNSTEIDYGELSYVDSIFHLVEPSIIKRVWYVWYDLIIYKETMKTVKA